MGHNCCIFEIGVHVVEATCTLIVLLQGFTWDVGHRQDRELHILEQGLTKHVKNFTVMFDVFTLSWKLVFVLAYFSEILQPSLSCLAFESLCVSIVWIYQKDKGAYRIGHCKSSLELHLLVVFNTLP